jgi:hypothetical protein
MIPEKPAPDLIRGGPVFEKIMRKQGMIPKSGTRFSGKIMRKQSMIPKSGTRFSGKIMRKQRKPLYSMPAGSSLPYRGARAASRRAPPTPPAGR